MRSSRFFSVTGLALLISLLAACGGSGKPTAPVTPPMITSTSLPQWIAVAAESVEAASEASRIERKVGMMEVEISVCHSGLSAVIRPPVRTVPNGIGNSSIRYAKSVTSGIQMTPNG